MGRAEDIIEDLLDEGALVDEGGFSIDEAHARRKLDHALSDPNAYVVVWARAALLRAPTELTVVPRWGRTTLRFDGRPLRERELAELYTWASLPDDAPGDAHSRRLLAQGIQAGLSGPGRVARVLSAIDGRLRGIEIESAADESVPQQRHAAPPGVHTIVELEHRRTLGRLRECLVAATPEHRWIRHALVYARVPVHLAGRDTSLSGPLAGPGMFRRQVVLDELGFEGLAISAPDSAGGKIGLVVGDLLVRPKPLPERLRHITAVLVRDDRLGLDASGLEIVEDARWAELLAAVHEADARWTELPAQSKALRSPWERLRPFDHGPAPLQIDEGAWTNFAALISALFLPGVFVGLGLQVSAVLLLVFMVPFVVSLRSIIALRRGNHIGIDAFVPSYATLLACATHLCAVLMCAIEVGGSAWALALP